MDTEKIAKRNVSMRMVLPKKKKNIRILITVNVVGSSGPLRFVVNEDDKVSTIIDSSLKLFVRGGRLPVLGSDFKSFTLYASDAGTAMNSSEEIGSCGGRNFVLYKKKNNQVPESRSRMITRQRSGRWKACIICSAH